MTRVIGLISGTSADGIDVALVDITGSQADLKVELVAGATYPYAPEVRSQILALAGGATISMPELAALDDAIAQAFATAALIIQQGHDKATLIGSHGQTVYHRPAASGDRSSLGYSLQLGRGALIAHLTGLTTVNNFRAADIAVGGQGAPLVPLVDTWLLGDPSCDRCVQNLGGIGNVTYLPSQNPGKNSDLGERSPQDSGVTGVLGWDTGPGNSLIDLAVEHFSQGAKTYDHDGAWAASGAPCQALVERWLEQEYFQQPPPKSTGRELFGVDYLHQCLADAAPYNLSPADVLATLTELTAASVVHSYRHFLPRMPDRVLLCGGGSHNRYLRQRLQTLLEPVEVMTTAEAGLNADFKEAIAFAVLAYWHIRGIVGGIPQVTGAKEAALLGEIHTPLTVRHDSIETQGQ